MNGTTNGATGATPAESPLAAVERASGAALGSWFGCTLPDAFSDGPDAWLEEYRAAKERVALLDENFRGYLRFTGPDRVRYLNAILTNNIKDLQPGRGVASLFLNPQGRILAEIETLAEAESLLCVVNASMQEVVVPALEKYIIMDDVTLAVETERFATIGVTGPQAFEAVKTVSGLDIRGWQDLSFGEARVGGVLCRVVKRATAEGAAADFISPRTEAAAVWRTLLEAVVAAGGRPAGYQALNALRLEQGVPWFGYDFGDKQIPHEAGLQDSHISYSKGCYTGQEIVERVRSRGQVNRVRLLVRFAGATAPAPGNVLTADGKEAGYVTRTGFSPRLGSVIGMAYLRREKSAPGTELECAGASAAVIGPRVE